MGLLQTKQVNNRVKINKELQIYIFFVHSVQCVKINFIEANFFKL